VVLEPNRAKEHAKDVSEPIVDWSAVELPEEEYYELRREEGLVGYIHEADDFETAPGFKCAKVHEMVRSLRYRQSTIEPIGSPARPFPKMVAHSEGRFHTVHVLEGLLAHNQRWL
jgi:hypothetical protein